MLSFFTSELFTFIVGPEKKKIVVHSGAVSRLSTPMTILMNGSMKEAQSKVADWSGLSVDDFFRFIQFAYMGDYTPPNAIGP